MFFSFKDDRLSIYLLFHPTSNPYSFSSNFFIHILFLQGRSLFYMSSFLIRFWSSSKEDRVFHIIFIIISIDKIVTFSISVLTKLATCCLACVLGSSLVNMCIRHEDAINSPGKLTKYDTLTVFKVTPFSLYVRSWELKKRFFFGNIFLIKN